MWSASREGLRTCAAREQGQWPRPECRRCVVLCAPLSTASPLESPLRWRLPLGPAACIHVTCFRAVRVQLFRPLWCTGNPAYITREVQHHAAVSAYKHPFVVELLGVAALQPTPTQAPTVALVLDYMEGRWSGTAGAAACCSLA